ENLLIVAPGLLRGVCQDTHLLERPPVVSALRRTPHGAAVPGQPGGVEGDRTEAVAEDAAEQAGPMQLQGRPEPCPRVASCFPDGLARTFLVVGAAQPVPWSKPADLAYAPDRPLPSLGGLFTRPVHVLCYEVRRRPGFNARFADGSARFLRSPA